MYSCTLKKSKKTSQIKKAHLVHAYPVAYSISGVLSNAREPSVRTLAFQILLDPLSEVEVVCGANKTHCKTPDVPLDNVLITVSLFLGHKAADSALCGSWKPLVLAFFSGSSWKVKACLLTSLFRPPARKSPLSRGVTGKRRNM